MPAFLSGIATRDSLNWLKDLQKQENWTGFRLLEMPAFLSGIATCTNAGCLVTTTTLEMPAFLGGIATYTIHFSMIPKI